LTFCWIPPFGGGHPGSIKAINRGIQLNESNMRILNFICLTAVQLAKWVWTLPQSIVTGFRDRRQQAELNAAETERLDRIRHPSKYLGK